MDLETQALINPGLVGVYMAYTDVTNLVWFDEAHTVLNCTVNFVEHGPTPYAAVAQDITLHCPEIFSRAVAGDFGPIAEHTPPTPEEVRVALPLLKPRAFWKTAGHIGVTKDIVIASINTIEDEGERRDALIDLEEATEFRRLDPTLVLITAKQGITPEQLDALWMWGYATYSTP
jgi:hypothetical protein